MAYGELKQTTYIYDNRLTTDGLSYFEVKEAARAEAERASVAKSAPTTGRRV